MCFRLTAAAFRKHNGHIVRNINTLQESEKNRMSQLKMICRLKSPAEYEPVIPDGFRIRPLNDGDYDGYNEMRLSVEFGAWRKDEDMISYEQNIALPDGHLVLERICGGKLCASAGAEKSCMTEFPHVGNLGWVMTRPDMQGHRFGKLICTAAMRILAAHGYEYATLQTDDFRIPAVKTYLNSEWRPWIYDDTMEPRWRAMCEIYKMNYDEIRKYPSDFQFNEPSNKI